MKRLLTAAICVPLALAALFRLPPVGFFLICAFFVTWAALEFVRLVRPVAPGAPLGALVALVPPAAWGLAAAIDGGRDWPAGPVLLAGAALLAIGCGSLVLFARTPDHEHWVTTSRRTRVTEPNAP